MNKVLIAWLAASIGLAGYWAYNRKLGESFNAMTSVSRQWQSATNLLATEQQTISSLQDDLQQKWQHWREVNRYSYISPEMLEILEGKRSSGHGRAWAELRQQLGIGWNSSLDYVLVNKRVIGEVWFNKLEKEKVSDHAAKLLSFSTDEQAAVNAAVAAVRQGNWLNVTSAPPSGEIVAQYGIVLPDPAMVATLNDAFTSDVTAAIGSERADLFLKDGWLELRASLAPVETETMEIRQITVNGQPDLVCEETDGVRTSTMPVRYAHYPRFPVLKMFPGTGWEGLAKEWNFNLPASFHDR